MRDCNLELSGCVGSALVNRLPKQKTMQFIHLSCLSCNVKFYANGTFASITKVALVEFWKQEAEVK